MAPNGNYCHRKAIGDRTINYLALSCLRFEHILNNNFPETETDEDALKYHIKVIQLIRADLQNAIDSYDKLFIK